jgi:hypothetical protein
MRRFAALALVPLAVTACSGDSKGEAKGEATRPPAPPAGRGAYVAKADATCARFAGEHPEIARSIRSLQGLTMESPNVKAKLAKHYGLVLTVAREFEDEFKKIPPPAADRERIDELNKLNDEALALLDQAVPALRAGRNPQPEFEQYIAKLGAANQLAAVYGFEVCSRYRTGGG